MADSSWSVPFFPPQKRHIAHFLRTINVGIGTNPPSLVPLVRRKPSGSTSTDDASPDDGTSSWICPAISPRSKGLACPVALYGEKTVPPKRSERRITPRRRHRRAPNSGPNHADHCDDNDAGHHSRNFPCASSSNNRNDSDVSSNGRSQAIVPC